MKYQEVVEKLKTRKYMARLSHWKPDVWISYSQNKCGELVLTYDDGELFDMEVYNQLAHSREKMIFQLLFVEIKLI